MDPLTAFSLACGVIQVVDFSMKVLAKCKEIHDHGALSEHQEVEKITKHLTDVRIDTSHPQSSGTTQTPDDRELLDLAKTCSATADHLFAKLQTLKIEGPRKKRQAIVKTVKAHWERRELHDMEKRLNSYRSVLDTKILVNLRFVGESASCLFQMIESNGSGMRPQLTVADLCLCRQRSDLASIQQRHDFQTLDQGIQRLITNLSEGPKSFEELRKVIRKENEETREHISKAFQQQQKQLDRKEYRKRLLDSLWFDEIHSREENIVDAHRETFEWILDVSDHAVGPWDNFVQWLESGQGTYWINGKAGSGKSTLMSFLCQDDRTMKSLRSWSDNQNKNAFMPKFFFWNAGKQMEKSIEGLLRSLIWQVLQILPDLEITSSASHSRDTLAAWTERRLQNTLRDLIQQASSSHFFCFFIDGLDEYEGDQVNLIHFIRDLVQINAVKVCLSSRPYRVFEQAFGLSSRLRLQDLTHSDIQKFVFDRFKDMPQAQSIAVQRLDWLDDVTECILARADGVFLWVTLAVKDQIRGLENGDSVEQLQERLESLPDEVEGIYARMLGQIEKVYRKEASIFLQVASQTAGRSVLEFVLASQDRLEDMLSSSDRLPEQELIAKSQLARQRIATTCAGLLEVNDLHEVASHEHSNSVSENESLESEDALLQPDNTSLSESASSRSKDVSLKSENAALELDSKPDDASSSSGQESIHFRGEAIDDEIFDLQHKVTVDYIHRTARDFMLDSTQGGTFLKANIPSGFHPQVSYIKVLVAKLRLFGCLRYSNRHPTPDDIMKNIRLAEDETGVAQTGLCDLIEDVMSRIDRTCGPWPTNIHWSVRWADQPWPNMHKELLPSDSKASSPSSSNYSFHSVNSYPDLSNDLGMTLVKKTSFLAFAVYHNLRRYVQKVLQDRKEPLDADTVSYLLYCTVNSRGMPWRSPIIGREFDLGLVYEFLRRGGSPNLRDSHLTIWSTFLDGMRGSIYRYLMRNLEDNEHNENSLLRAYVELAVVFIEQGADLHSNFRTSKAGLLVVDYSDYFLEIEISPLAAIELCLKDVPGYSHLRKICAEKGAPYYLRCTQVIKSTRVRKHEWPTPESKQTIELSDRESTAILDIYKKTLVHRSFRERENLEAELLTYLNELFRDPIEDASESEPL